MSNQRQNEVREWCYICRRLTKQNHLREVTVLLPSAKEPHSVRICLSCYKAQMDSDQSLDFIEATLRKEEEGGEGTRETTNNTPRQFVSGDGTVQEVYDTITLDATSREGKTK